MEGKLLMVHIPKCAGITMNLIIGLDNPKYFGNKYGHNYASFIKREMGGEYDKLTTFCIVRNPWDKLWSSYNFMKSGSTFKAPSDKSLLSFETFISDIYNGDKYLQHLSQANDDNLYFHKQKNWVFDNGKQVVDIIGKFEDLTSLVEKLEVDFELDGLHDKFKTTHSNRTNKGDYKHHYTDEMIELVREMYGDDIKTFGYEFEN